MMSDQLRDLADSLGRGGKADRPIPINSGQRSENVRGGTGSNLLTIPRALGNGGDRPGNGPAVDVRLHPDDEASEGIS